MKRPSKYNFANTPTPIHKLEHLSSLLKKNICIKRDDLTGVLVTGNKIRKLEYVIQDAIDLKADTIVTCGGLQSNHVRTTTIISRTLGLNPVAVLRGEEPPVFEGNTLLTAIFSDEIIYVTEDEYNNIEQVYSDLDKKFRKRGLIPYFIPEGASNTLGCWGYISMMEELDKQLKELDLKFDSIFVALGSGGTQAGMILGKYLTGNTANIFGVNVFKVTREFEEHISYLCTDAIKQYGFPFEYNKNDLHILNDYIGNGYAKTTDKEMKLFIDLAVKESIIFDQVYTGKAVFGMIDQLENHPGSYGENILFIHTGGLFGLFPEKERITNLLRNK
ncbi:1-aminocyclopropane-1-carboxylate deaminase/D-cysteine desulfhydrase [candidate division KSB1 bacterium]